MQHEHIHRASVPIRVWAGSTNFTDAGFFLQTNVGIVLRDPTIGRSDSGSARRGADQMPVWYGRQYQPITFGTVDDAEDPNAIWLVAPDEISEVDQAGADGGTAVLAVEIANL